MSKELEQLLVRAIRRTGNYTPARMGTSDIVAAGGGAIVGPNGTSIDKKKYPVAQVGDQNAVVEDWGVYVRYLDPKAVDLQLKPVPLSGDNADPRAPLEVHVEWGVGTVAMHASFPVNARGLCVHVSGSFVKVWIQRHRTTLEEVKFAAALMPCSPKQFTVTVDQTVSQDTPLPKFSTRRFVSSLSYGVTFKDNMGNAINAPDNLRNTWGIPDLAVQVLTSFTPVFGGLM